MTLQANLNSHDLGSKMISVPGDVTLAWDVATSDFDRPISVAKFVFDKARPPIGAEKRELAAMAGSVSLEAR